MKNKVTIMIGAPDTGKTIRARRIASQYKKENVREINGRGKIKDFLNPFRLRTIHEGVEVIIIDEFVDVKNIDLILGKACDGIEVEHAYKDPFYINPRIIVVCNHEIKISDLPMNSIAFRRRCTVIDCNILDEVTSTDPILPTKRSKLTTIQTDEIKSIYAHTDATVKDLCDMYNVSVNTVWRYVSNITPSISKRRSGEKCNFCKIDEYKAKKILTLYMGGHMTQSAISKMFGIHQTNVHNICSGKTWKHLFQGSKYRYNKELLSII